MSEIIESFETKGGKEYSKRRASNDTVYFVLAGEGHIPKTKYRMAKAQFERHQRSSKDVQTRRSGGDDEPRPPRNFREANERFTRWQLKRRGWL